MNCLLDDCGVRALGVEDLWLEAGESDSSPPDSQRLLLLAVLTV